MRTILFVCSGNTCRSPMAEAIARHLIIGMRGQQTGTSSTQSDSRGSQNQPADNENEVFVTSAGISAVNGLPTTFETIEALNKMGIEYDGQSKALNPAMVNNADLVLGMTFSHMESIKKLIGDASDSSNPKISTLDPQEDISDPIGMGQEAYDQLAERMKSLILTKLEELF